MPHKASKAAQQLHYIKQSVIAANSFIAKSEVRISNFEAFPQAEREAAIKLLDAEGLIAISKALIAATKPPKLSK